MVVRGSWKKERMAITQLTPEGWSGATSGVWSKRSNVVINRKDGIEVRGVTLVDSLAGDDVITGEQQKGAGVLVSNEPRRASVQMGGGDDTLTGISKQGSGIDNRGYIFMGSGDDTIIGRGGSNGIRNRGFIFTQGGDDVVDVREGGIRGRGFIDLGGGNNTFIGFGNHQIYGGEGRDTLLLAKGTYELSKRSKSRYFLERGKDQLELFDFDVVGAIDSRKSQRIDIDQSGTLVVKDNGTITLT
jgi:hypothetical protein